MKIMVTWQILVLVQHSSYTDVLHFYTVSCWDLVSSMDYAFALFAFV